MRSEHPNATLTKGLFRVRPHFFNQRERRWLSMIYLNSMNRLAENPFDRHPRTPAGERPGVPIFIVEAEANCSRVPPSLRASQWRISALCADSADCAVCDLKIRSRWGRTVLVCEFDWITLKMFGCWPPHEGYERSVPAFGTSDRHRTMITVRKESSS